MSMKVLVAGGAGYIGSQTAKLLAACGIEPVTYDDFSAGHRWAVRWGPLVEGNLSDGALLRQTIREHDIQAVVHFAASTYVGESVHDPRKYFQNNVVNSLSLLDAMVDTGVKPIVFSSTCATYGDPIQVPISETHPQLPVNPYGESKLFVEKAMRWYNGAYGLRHASLRYFNAAGADPEGDIGEEHEPETHLIPLAIHAVLGRTEKLQIYGTDYPTPDGTAIRDYIHVVDLAKAHLKALELLLAGTASIAVNLGTGKGHSVREVIAAVEQASGRKVPVELTGRRAGDPPELVADPRKAKEILGWSAGYLDLKEIMATAWKWHKKHG